MLSVPLDALQLSKREKAYCRKADLVNAGQILFASSSDSPAVRSLVESTQFDHIQEVAAYAQAPRSSSILDILEDTCASSTSLWKEEEEVASDSDETVLSDNAAGKRKQSTQTDQPVPIAIFKRFTLTTGDKDMDALLGGGIRRGCLTEIVGESASGKSQFGMQTAVFAALGLVPLEDRQQGEADFSGQGEEDDLYHALRGCGIRPTCETGGVAILNSGGGSIGQMMIRRMIELADFLVEERWMRMAGEKYSQVTGKKRKINPSPSKKKSSGVFREEGSRRSLKEAQSIAKSKLLENIHLASPKDYESLEHAISYALPALTDRLKLQGKSPLCLVIVDDLPELLFDEGESTTQKGFLLRRSRLMCDITDRLKRLAMSCGDSDSTISPRSTLALVVMNQVVDTFARNHEVLLPLLSRSAWSSDSPLQISGPPPMSSAFQDGYFNGILASADIETIQKARSNIAAGIDQDESIQRVSSTTKMAALGHSWVNCINVRVMLTRTRRIFTCSNKEKVVVRRAVSVLNPFGKAGQGWDPHVEYVIQRNGFRGLSNPPSPSESFDEEQLWSSFEADFKSADLNLLIDREEQLKQDREDSELWALSSGLDDELELPSSFDSLL